VLQRAAAFIPARAPTQAARDFSAPHQRAHNLQPFPTERGFGDRIGMNSTFSGKFRPGGSAAVLRQARPVALPGVFNLPVLSVNCKSID